MRNAQVLAITLLRLFMVNIAERVPVENLEWEEILASPQFLLHSLNTIEGMLNFINCDRVRLSQTSFIDGRSSLSSNSTSYTIPLEYALAWHANRNDQDSVNRFIFHTSFCGSTLMARMLNSKGKVFTYKEPQIFLQLADMQSRQADLCRNNERWNRLLEFVLSQFSAPWSPGEVNLIKPSNWVNTLICDLLTASDQSKVVFLSMTAESFLTAVFRGGSERVQYIYNLVHHLKQSLPEYGELIAHVEQNSEDTVNLFSRLTLIAHAMQSKCFALSAKMLNDRDRYICSYDDLCGSPQSCIKNVAGTLMINLSDSDIEVSVKQNMQRHSKVIDRSYTRHNASQTNCAVLSRYQENFSRALQWKVETLDSMPV